MKALGRVIRLMGIAIMLVALSVMWAGAALEERNG